MHPDFSGKTLLITGGTGSFGNGAVARLLAGGRRSRRGEGHGLPLH